MFVIERIVNGVLLAIAGILITLIPIIFAQLICWLFIKIKKNG